MKRLLFIAPAVAFLALLGAFFLGLGRDPSILPSQLIDKPVPAFSLPPVQPGKPGLEHTEFTGEPKLLNVFASWCAACRIEHPYLMRLRAYGVPIHGLDWKDEPADGAAWLDQFGDPYLRAGNDRTGRTGIDLGVTGAPETFVIDGKGRVRYRHVGVITPQVWEETIKPLMDKLRQES
jgi:cytochrome c biogenesis protein CcmG, thiol:disulfide interchange protein DsbE